jgi:phage baseplate assembly protein V
VFVGGDADLEQVLDKVTRLGEYGFFSVPPAKAEAVVLYPDGERSGGVIIATGHRPSRPKNLRAGEAGVYNGLTGAVLRLDHDGKAYLNCDLVVTGNIIASQDVLDRSADGNEATVKNLRDAYDAHKHTGVQGGAGTTGPTDHNV